MNYSETLEYLYKTLPMFQRIGAAAYKADLSNTVALCETLGNPQHRFKSVHIAGTNGKGSSSHILAAILQCAGYKTGLYTSPHLKEFTERIRINGQEASTDFIVDFVGRIKTQLEKINPSFFETTVAMAFDYFALHEVDVAVIEVGLGGRLDSTNVITPVVSLITNIGFDHMDILGHTLPAIAAEKAGIIKQGVPVVISQRQREVAFVFEQKALELEATLTFASDVYRASPLTTPGSYQVSQNNAIRFDRLECQLKGAYQQYNLPGILATVDHLRETGFNISDDNIREGIGRVSSLTGLKGRWQKLGDKPLIICDTGHNVDGIREVTKQIKAELFHTLHMVFGMVKDKDIIPVLNLLPRDAHYYFCQAKIPRAMPAHELAQRALAEGIHGEVIEDVREAIMMARKNAQPDDFIFIGGSTFVVAEIENL
jgi:dihydrofolate synthase / folylpolyglutamate synthase